MQANVRGACPQSDRPDRRAIFVGAEAYTEAGGTIIRDLFSEDRGGSYEDPALLGRLAIKKLEGIAADVRQAEGWKWTDVHIDFPHAHGMRRAYPHAVELSEEAAAAADAAQAEYNALTEQYDSAEESMPYAMPMMRTKSCAAVCSWC
jgi:ParB family chromosome partitioning protein